jgi:3-hydroxybutyryl-CoA dehydrogenase
MTITASHSVIIFGAGTMGAGIAALFAKHGWDTTCIARSEASLTRARLRIEATLQQDTASIEHSLHYSTDHLAGPEEPDLVIESIPESLVAKVELLKSISERLGPRTIVTSNTSSIDLAELSGQVPVPERFAGLHWFNPPELVELVEIIRAPKTNEWVLETLDTWVTSLGKTTVTLRRPVKGFVVNRLQYALLREAYALVEDGICSWQDVDLALVKCLGPRWAAVGPFQSMDLGGLDLHAAVAGELFPELSCTSEVPAALSAMVAEGRLGCKTGEGLLGSYSPERIEELAKRRFDVLDALRGL